MAWSPQLPAPACSGGRRLDAHRWPAAFQRAGAGDILYFVLLLRPDKSAGENAMSIVDRFPRCVREIETVWIPLSDGTRLAARVWLPEDADAAPVPAHPYTHALIAASPVIDPERRREKLVLSGEIPSPVS